MGFLLKFTQKALKNRGRIRGSENNIYDSLGIPTSLNSSMRISVSFSATLDSVHYYVSKLTRTESPLDGSLVSGIQETCIAENQKQTERDE